MHFGEYTKALLSMFFLLYSTGYVVLSPTAFIPHTHTRNIFFCYFYLQKLKDKPVKTSLNKNFIGKRLDNVIFYIKSCKVFGFYLYILTKTIS